MKFCLLFMLSLIPFFSIAQTPQLDPKNGSRYSMGGHKGWYIPDSGLVVPNRNAKKSAAGIQYNKPGRLWFDQYSEMGTGDNDSAFYGFDGMNEFRLFSTKDTDYIQSLAVAGHDDQQISISNDTIFLENGGYVVLPLSAADSTFFTSIYRDDTGKKAIRDTHVPYTGATANVNLGTYEAVLDAVQLNLTPSGAGTPGRMAWNVDDNTVEVQLNADVTLQMGEEMYVRCVNTTGATITKGQVVYINDALGNKPTIALAQANTVNTSLIIGVATEDIADNATGFVTTQGIVRNIDTRPFTTDGQPLYLSVDTPGLITKTIPTTPNITAFIGFALNTTVNGSIYIRPEVPINADTSLTNASNRVSATQGAVKAYVDNRVSGSLPISDSITIYATQYGQDTTSANLYAWAWATFLTSFTETDPLSFHKVDSNTSGEAITYSYFWTNIPSLSGYLQLSDTVNNVSTRSWRQKGIDSINVNVALKANIASPALTGTPTAPTAAINNNSTQIATTEYVDRYFPVDTTISAAYTLTSRDFHRTIHCTNGSNIALTIPTGLGTTFECVVLAEGAGTVTPTTSSTTFYYQPTSTTKIKSQGGATIRSWATANSYLIIGSLE